MQFSCSKGVHTCQPCGKKASQDEYFVSKMSQLVW